MEEKEGRRQLISRRKVDLEFSPNLLRLNLFLVFIVLLTSSLPLRIRYRKNATSLKNTFSPTSFKGKLSSNVAL